MKAPFPWFGGKRRVAPLIWKAFGDVDNYVEPFAGSLAVLLERPAWHKARAETVNDADQFLANFWRALAHDPEAVARWADWPVNEADLFARHLWLVNTGRERLASMDTDPDFYDAQVAGWWVWGICAWIGSGWCSGTGPHTLDTVGKLPHLGDAGQGVNQPDGPEAFTAGGSGAPPSPWTNPLPDLPVTYGYLAALAERLRSVRVCCGDWTRVVTRGALNYGATVGVLLDPPYLGDVRTSDLYAADDHHIAEDVREWAVAHGDDPRLRIALCGYEPEHVDYMPSTWRMHTYSASKSYGSSAGGGVNDANRALERIWFSPHCLSTEGQGSLFEAAS